MLQALQHILTECFLLHVCEAVYPFLSVCVYMYIVCMGCLRRCAGSSPEALGWGEVLTRPQLCQICPNQTKGAEKTQAAHQGFSNQGNRERKKGKVDTDFTIISLISCQIEAKSMDFSV